MFSFWPNYGCFFIKFLVWSESIVSETVQYFCSYKYLSEEIITICKVKHISSTNRSASLCTYFFKVNKIFLVYMYVSPLWIISFKRKIFQLLSYMYVILKILFKPPVQQLLTQLISRLLVIFINSVKAVNLWVHQIVVV